MQDSKLAAGGLGKKSDIRLAKKIIKGLQGFDNKDANDMKALMNEVLRGGYKPFNKAMGGSVQKMEDGGLTILDKTMKPKSEDALGKLSQKDKDDYKEMKDYLKPSVQKQLGNAFKNLTTRSKKNDTQRAIARGQAKQIIRTVGKMDGGVKAQRIAKKGGNPDIQKKMGFVGETRGPKKFKYGGAVNTTRSVQINPFTGEPI